jgi:hypothetical protein
VPQGAGRADNPNQLSAENLGFRTVGTKYTAFFEFAKLHSLSETDGDKKQEVIIVAVLSTGATQSHVCGKAQVSRILPTTGERLMSLAARGKVHMATNNAH